MSYSCTYKLEGYCLTTPLSHINAAEINVFVFSYLVEKRIS